MTDRRPAVFLDRDGTVIEDRGHLSRPDQVAFIPGAFAALTALQSRFLLFIVTNQGGIAQGLLSREEVDRVNAHVARELEQKGVRIRDTYVCPHDRSQGCDCIKPNPLFLLRAARDHHLDLSRSFTVGDHPHDAELAHRAGACAGVFVLTGHGPKHCSELAPGTPIADDIRQATAMITNWNSRSACP